jgi:hypothetical protein
MPLVTVPPRPNGLPTAMTQSPTLALSLSPNLTKGSGFGASIFSSARSVFTSLPMILAGCWLSSCKVTVTLSASPTTWLLVTI